jgi:hypothetical protein
VSEDPRRDDIFEEEDDFVGEDMTFDELARGVANGTISRGRALKLFGATVAATLLPAGIAEAVGKKCRTKGQTCSKKTGKKCCKGLVCRRSKKDGKRRCRRRRRPKTTTTTTTTPRPGTTTTTTTTPAPGTTTTTTTTTTPPPCLVDDNSCTQDEQCCSDRCEDNACCSKNGTPCGVDDPTGSVVCCNDCQNTGTSFVCSSSIP